MTEHTTGKGRAAPELPTFTFANGAVATLRPVSQFTQAHIEIQLRKQHPAPTPPLNAVDYGDGKVVHEPNPADPAYEAALKEWQALFSIHVLDAMVELAVEVEVDTAALGSVRATLDRLGLPLDEISEKVAYVKHCCMFDIATESTALAQALRSLIGPRPEDVADHIATFPDHVPGT